MDKKMKKMKRQLNFVMRVIVNSVQERKRSNANKQNNSNNNWERDQEE